MAKLIFGCGYLGERVLALWKSQGEKVYAVTRSPTRAAEWSQCGIAPLVIDISKPIEVAAPTDIKTVLFAVGFDAKAGPSIREVYVDGLARVLAWLPSSVKRFISISSTGVFGSCDGEWIDEAAHCEPQREGGKACLAAEKLLAESPFADRSVVLRLAGIYGPQRIPRAKDLLEGKPLEAVSSGYLNLIHVADAANIVLLAEQKPTSRCLLVSDGRPVVRSDYYAELARLLNAPPPQYAPAADDPPIAKRGSADKRISNARLVRELSPEFLFPDYRAGLADAVADWKIRTAVQESMAKVSSGELQQFLEFIQAKLGAGEVHRSPEEVLDQWRELHPVGQLEFEAILRAGQVALEESNKDAQGISATESDRQLSDRAKEPGA